MLQSTILVIVGITGDLAKRKLLPAIDELAKAGKLPEAFKIVGITRQNDVSIGRLTKYLDDATFITTHTDLFQMDLSRVADYDLLQTYLEQQEQALGQNVQRLFYLSVPPQVSRPIIEYLGTAGLAKQAHAKLLLEKPFGVDLSSAEELVDHIEQFFAPKQVYRIDHYLAKEMAQNIMTFRSQNALFNQTWNSDYIDSIVITASEAIGIEGRAHFYEQTGALRDLVQSHLLQLAALVLMELPHDYKLKDIPAQRLAALRNLYVGHENDGLRARRGQYAGYIDEVHNVHSTVETFAHIMLLSKSPQWRGVPITIATGKAMAQKYTEISIRYKAVGGHSNTLVLRLQPNEGAGLTLQTKVPGYDHRTEQRMLNFSYDKHERLPEAYERVLLDAINSDHSLFASSQEVLETWRILNPVQRAWSMTAADVQVYPKGSDITTL